MAGKRKKGEGTVRLRKDGRWEGRVVVGYDETGNPKTKNVLAKTKRECVEKLEQLKEQCGNHSPTQVRPDMPFGAWMDYWYQNFSKTRLRPTTQLSYEGWIYNHLIPGLGHIQLNRLTQADLQQFFRTMKESGRKSNADKRGKGMADRSVRSCHAVCQMALDRAVEEKLIHGNPAAGCRLPPIKGREMQVLTHEEIQRFLIQAKAEGMYELFLLDLTTGMRRGELLALRWDDLDFDTGKLRIDKQICPVGGKLIISEPKTKAANRTIILPPAMLEVLAEYKKGIFSDLMFPSRIKPDQPIDPGYVRKRLQVILKRAGCKSVRFHDLRHTFATMSLENGMDVKTLSTIIGHVSSATTLKHRPGDRGRGGGSSRGRRKDRLLRARVHPRPARPPQAGHWLPQANRGKPMGGAILPHLAGREKALPKRLRPHRSGVRGKAGGTDPSDEGGDRCPALRSQHGVSGRRQPQEEGHHRLSAGASRRDQQGHDRQRAGRGSLHGAAVLR